MGVKNYKPTSAGRRLMTVSDFAEITKSKPEKKLTKAVRKSGGRNAHGHITTRHVGGGHKRRYRIIDWRREKDGVPAKVAAIEYDPNRTHRAAPLQGRREAVHPRAGRRERRRRPRLGRGGRHPPRERAAGPGDP